MKKKLIVIIILLVLLSIILSTLSAGFYRSKNSDQDYPSMPDQINKQVLLGFDLTKNFQPIHINMDRNEHYVLLAKSILKGDKYDLKLLIYNAPNTFYTIDDIEDYNFNHDTLKIFIRLKKIGFFSSQVQSPKCLSLPKDTMSKVEFIDVRLMDRSSRKEISRLASEVGGHICKSRIIK